MSDAHGGYLMWLAAGERGAARAACGRWQRFLAAPLLAAALLVGAATTATAGESVCFPDQGLRAAVVTQLVRQGALSLGGDGTTITASGVETMTTLSARSRGIVDLGGLQHATGLASLDLSGNEIASITVLGGLANMTELDLRGNRLDLSSGSSAMSVITSLEASGTHVSWKPQRARLSGLVISASAAKYGKPVTFSAGVSPGGAGALGTAKLRLYRLETKTVTKRVKGKKKKVAVNYWRLRRTLAMKCSAGSLVVTSKLPLAGKWQARVTYASSGTYEPCESAAVVFVVRDPRIEAAIRWAMKRRGRHTWDHYCLRFVSDSYARGARASVRRYETARQAARALRASAHRSANAPRGAWVFYDSTPNGHVGISLGDGTMINDYGGAGVKVMRIKSGGHYVGWAPPPVAPAIGDWRDPPER